MPVSKAREIALAAAADPEGVLAKARAPWLGAGREEYNGNPDDYHGTACPVITIGLLPVDAPAPEQRGNDEHAAVRRIYPAEVAALLEGRNNTVQNQDDRAQDADDDRCPVAEPSPDQVAAANLGQSGSDEQGDSPNDSHTLIMRHGTGDIRAAPAGAPESGPRDAAAATSPTGTRPGQAFVGQLPGRRVVPPVL
jgi:hypothetical protein